MEWRIAFSVVRYGHHEKGPENPKSVSHHNSSFSMGNPNQHS